MRVSVGPTHTIGPITPLARSAWATYAPIGTSRRGTRALLAAPTVDRESIVAVAAGEHDGDDGVCGSHGPPSYRAEQGPAVSAGGFHSSWVDRAR
jgi:hypothetical protein